MAEDLASNPFAALFSSLETAKAFTEAVAASDLETEIKVTDNANGKELLGKYKHSCTCRF